jgi:hypothetical protein
MVLSGYSLEGLWKNYKIFYSEQSVCRENSVQQLLTPSDNLGYPVSIKCQYTIKMARSNNSCEEGGLLQPKCVTKLTYEHVC